MVRLLLWFVTAFLVVQTLIGNGGLTDTLRATRERRALTQAIADLKSENRRLAEASRRLREDPAAIEAVAREQMGLAAPGEVLFIVRDLTESLSLPE
jgi:cell division protein FtsB